MSSLLKGLLIGATIAVIGVAIVGTGGLAAVALIGAGAALGAGMGAALGTLGAAPAEVTGKIIGPGSSNVFTNGIPAARAKSDMTICAKHSPSRLPIMSGSANVFINGLHAARVSDKTACSAVIVTGSGNVFIGGGNANIHPIHALTDGQITEGRKDPVDYARASFNEEDKIITIEILMDYAKPHLGSRASGLASGITDEEFEKYMALANGGLAKHWSRQVKLDGATWTVNVIGKRSDDGLPMTLANPGWDKLGDMSGRSRNPDPVLSGNLYYTSRGDADFAETAAHEIGHSFLTDAFGVKWSWGHEGTSSVLGELHKDAPMYPAKGEVGLMPYYRQNRTRMTDIPERTIASEDDVKGLIYISGRSN